MIKKPIIFGSDQAGACLKSGLIEGLRSSRGFQNWDISEIELDDGAPYPEVATFLAYRVVREDAIGVLICDTGIGMCMAANKSVAVRAAACHDTYSASMARAHNDANVLCMGSQVITLVLAQNVLSSFLLTPFEGGEYLERVNMIRELENRGFKP